MKFTIKSLIMLLAFSALQSFACGGGGVGGGAGSPGFCAKASFASPQYLYETLNGEVVYLQNGEVLKRYPEDLSTSTLELLEESYAQINGGGAGTGSGVGSSL